MARYYLKRDGLNTKKYKKTIGILLTLVGSLTLLFFLFPILSYQIFLTDYRNNIETPIPKNMIAREDNIRSLITQGINYLTSDYGDARNWYPQVTEKIQKRTNIDSYLLSIPKLKIENAEVSTVDYDLDHHLIQYLGTAIPGDLGTAVIFGHSTLPQLFDPKNYKTIFANVHTLKVGDEFFATVEGSRFKYKIFSIVVTTPEDTNILSQGYDHSYITIVTCTPPGTIWKRLVIRAALEQEPS